MHMRRLALIMGLAFTVASGAVYAQQHMPDQHGPEINISIGSALKGRANDFGPRELDYLRDDLRDSVSRAFAHARNVPARVDLVIEDATPNRPTFAQLSRNVGLSMESIGLGGARVSGAVVGPDGASRPVRYQYFETDLRNDRGAITWSDADRTFMMLADELAHGHVPDRYIGPGPQPNGGHFGYPYSS